MKKQYRSTVKHVFASFCRVLVLVMFGNQALAAKVALVIGNQAYEDIRPLKNSVNDATAVAEKLTNLDFRVIGLTSDEDGRAALNLDKAQLYKLLSRFQREALGADMAFFYYAGHGAIIGKDSYILPVDAPKPDEASQIAVLASDSISLTATLSYLSGVSGPKIAVFDACREVLDQETRSLLGPDGNNLVRGGLVLPQLDSGQIIAFAGAAGQQVLDGDGSHSPYTQVLLDELEAGQGRDVTEFLQTVGGKFLQNNSGLLNGQRPEYTNTGVLPSSYFLAGTKGIGPVILPPKHPDEIAWQRISSSQKAEDFDWFLANFPSSPNASLAIRLRDSLKKNPYADGSCENTVLSLGFTSASGQQSLCHVAKIVYGPNANFSASVQKERITTCSKQIPVDQLAAPVYSLYDYGFAACLRGVDNNACSGLFGDKRQICGNVLMKRAGL